MRKSEVLNWNSTISLLFQYGYFNLNQKYVLIQTNVELVKIKIELENLSLMV